MSAERKASVSEGESIGVAVTVMVRRVPVRRAVMGSRIVDTSSGSRW